MVGQIAAQGGQAGARVAPPILRAALFVTGPVSSFHELLSLQFRACVGAYRLTRSEGQQPGLQISYKAIRPTDNGARAGIFSGQEIRNSAAQDDHGPSTTAAASSGIVPAHRASAVRAAKPVRKSRQQRRGLSTGTAFAKSLRCLHDSVPAEAAPLTHFPHEPAVAAAKAEPGRAHEDSSAERTSLSNAAHAGTRQLAFSDGLAEWSLRRVDTAAASAETIAGSGPTT